MWRLPASSLPTVERYEEIPGQGITSSRFRFASPPPFPPALFFLNVSQSDTNVFFAAVALVLQ